MLNGIDSGRAVLPHHPLPGKYPVLVRVKDAVGNFVDKTVYYSVVNRVGGIAVTSSPKPLSIAGGKSGVLNVKLISTANIDDSVDLTIDTNGIAPASAINLTWFTAPLSVSRYRRKNVDRSFPGDSACRNHIGLLL